MTRHLLIAVLLLTASCDAKPPLTAAQLSEPGALQAYTDMMAKTGVIDLESVGTIRVPEWRLVRYKNCVIRGSGTTIVGTDSDKPTVRQAQTFDLRVEGLTVRSKSPVAWQQEHWHGAGTLMTRFSGVKFHRAGKERQGVGIAFGTKPSDAGCADAVLDHCHLQGFGTAVSVNGVQAVRIVVSGQTEVRRCSTVVRINAGGHVRLLDCGVIGASLLCECGHYSAGSSLQPAITMDGVYCDDAGGITRILDASKANTSGQFVADIRSVKCNVGNGQGTGVNLIVIPKGKHARAEIGLITKTGRANVEPTTRTAGGG